MPPWGEDRLRRLDEAGRPTSLAWAWDPASADAIERIVNQRAPAIEAVPDERHLWICDDVIINNMLVQSHEALASVMRTGGGRVPPAVLEAWSVYHRLRTLAVPLIQLEEERQKAYGTLTLDQRIRTLEDQEPSAAGPLGACLDVYWPAIVKTLRSTYDTFLQRTEPAKFYTLAGVVTDRLQRRRPDLDITPVRIAAPTQHEANMLAALLGHLVDGWPEALQAGTVTVSTVRDEPRRVASGDRKATVLLGYRTSESRHLDVYPGVPVDVVAYPYEAEVDEGIHQRVHASIEHLQEDGVRMACLEALRLPVHRTAQNSAAGGTGHRQTAPPRTPRPHVRQHWEAAPPPPTIRRLRLEAAEALDIDRLAGMSWTDEIVVSSSTDRAESATGTAHPGVEFVEITDVEGERVRFPESRSIDVYRPATRLLERVPAGDLLPGALMVVLVDDRYEDLFHRLLEAIEEQRDARSSMALELWQHAKQAVLARHAGNRRRLHEHLVQRGLSVDYAAVVGWYASGESEILAPLTAEDFTILAQASGLYTDAHLMHQTFDCIRRERTVRRSCGRCLRRLLVHMAAGENYEAALDSANALGTPVEQVASAVSLCEVRSIRRLGGLSGIDLQ